MNMLHKIIVIGLVLALFSVPGRDSQAADKKPAGRVLFIMTSNRELFGTGKKTGLWLDTLATPYYTLKQAGYDVTLASVTGGMPPLDPRGEEAPTKATERFHQDKEAMQLLSETAKFEQINADDYDALFVTGGHGLMWDCMDNVYVKKLLWGFANAKKLIIAADHGSAVLMQLQSENGTSLLKDRKIAAPTREEENQLKFYSVLPAYTDVVLEKAGAIVVRGKPFAPNAVHDDIFITSQNPASTDKLVKLMMDALKKKKRP